MKALLLWADQSSPNLGVRALAAGTGELLRRAFGAIDVDEYMRPYPDGPSPVHLGYAELGKGLLTRRGVGRQWLGSYDIVVDTGGGDSFADIYGLDRLLLISTVRQSAVRAGTPVVIGPQTLGPFKGRRARVLARLSVRGVHTVIARDTESERYGAVALRCPIFRSTDVVFALPVPPDPAPRAGVLLNVSGLLWRPNPHVDHLAYRRLCAEVLSGLRARGHHVRLLSHVVANDSDDEDEQACAALLAETGLEGVEVVVPADLDDVRRHIASSELVIGARMHACLNGLSLGVPVLPLAYSRKFAPLMRDLKWPYSVELDGASSTRVLELADDVLLQRDLAQLVAEQARERLEGVVEALRSAVVA